MSKKKRIWIINQYSGTPYYGMNYRSYYFAKEFVKNGYDVTVFSGSYSHLFSHYPRMDHIFEEEKIDGIRYVWVQTPQYGHAQSLGRVMNMFVFMYRLFRFNTKHLSKPDTIILSSLSLFPIVNAYMWAKKYKAKLIFEVRDIWPLTLIELGRVSKYHPFVLFMGLFEKFAHKKADLVVSPLQNYHIYLQERGIEKEFHWISNGIETPQVFPRVYLPERLETHIPENRFIVGYLGAFGQSNAIDFYLKAIALIPKELKITFLFVGDGELKKEIVLRSQKDHRIVVWNKVDKNSAFEIMRRCTILFKGNPAHKLYRYGIAPMKLFEYMLASRPIVHSTNVTHDIVETARCGIRVEAEDIQAIADGIVKLYHTPHADRMAMGVRGRRYVHENFSYRELAKKYQDIL